MPMDDKQTRGQCEQLEVAWQVLNDATVELSSHIATLSPDIYVSLRGAKDLISLCKSHPKLADLTPATVDSHEGYCVACCGSDIVGRIKCELRSVEDLLILKAMNELGSKDALKLQEKTMQAWQWTKPLTVTTR
ncbi:MAG: hypothetical protein ABSF63_03305 [Candidatus Bathyarchaeia archaeon]